MLKFENTAEVGDTVKCFDFQPMEGREQKFCIGTVVEKGYFEEFGVRGYRIAVTKDTVFDEGDRTEIIAPFGCLIGDFDNRIVKMENV
jgi:hypothetical protein